MIGSRVIKTCLAVALSILIARSLHLSSPQFSGIVAVLSVQPSVYRSVLNGLKQMTSAIMGALVGSLAMYFLGNSFLVMGVVAFLLMALHVKIKWNSSLLISVVIAINTMGSSSLFFGESALNQMSLVVIGTLIGTLVNAFHRPGHQVRAEVLVSQSEGMLRALLYYLHLNLQDQTITPYPEMRMQIEEVRSYIVKGKEISRLILEDTKFRYFSPGDMMTLFQTFENMIERIRDLTKGLGKIDTRHHEVVFLEKTILLVIHLQEHKINGKHIPSTLLQRVLQKRMDDIWANRVFAEKQSHLVAFFHLYNVLQEYLQVLDSLPRIDWQSEVGFHPNISGLREKISYLVVSRY